MTPMISGRLSLLYLFFFASLGAMLPYWGLYLQALQFSAAEIGELMAILMATKIVSPNVWGWIADRTGQPMRIVRLGALLALLIFSGVLSVTGYWQLAAVMVAFSFFWNAILPQIEAVTLARLGTQPQRYSTIRLWGSIGFILSVVILGATFEHLDIQFLPYILLALISGIWLASLWVAEAPTSTLPSTHVSLRSVLGQPGIVALLFTCFLMQASHGPYYTFYSIYLENHGYGRTLIGQLWALGVVAEVAIFLLAPRLVSRFGLRTLLLVSLSLATLRWVLIGLFPHLLPVLIGAQLLHAASFGLYHATAIQLVHRFFPGRLSGRGQALYSSLSFGAGGAIGSLYSGYLWSSVGSTLTFLCAGLLSALAVGLAWRRLRL